MVEYLAEPRARRREVRAARALPRDVLRHARVHGLRDTWRKAGERVLPHLYLREAHVWSVLPLPSSAEARPLPGGMSLGLGSYGDIALLGSLPSPVSPNEAERRLATGAQLWLVKDGGEAAFCAWTFTESAPAIAAPGGRLPLPPTHVFLDDTATASAYRGQGIAPAAWVAISDYFAAAGYRQVWTKVEVKNHPSRRAFAKAGFAEVAMVGLRRVAARNRVSVTDLGDAEAALGLRERLARC